MGLGVQGNVPEALPPIVQEAGWDPKNSLDGWAKPRPQWDLILGPSSP